MKIKNDYVKGEVIEILPKIFGVSIKDYYERSMLFCRYQEFYESPYKEIRGKAFSWETFMMVYKKSTKKDFFSYPIDWGGFNIPSGILNKGLSAFLYKSWGPYDEIMSNIYYHCENYPLKFEKPRTNWYLIGYGENLNTLKHEIAHGLYYTNRKYKLGMNNLISQIKKKDYTKIKKVLLNMGYANDKKILDDEIQAYMSTGLIKGFNEEDIKKYQKNFIELFGDYFTKDDIYLK